MLFTLPSSLAEELEHYARLVRGGNKSGFVADAVRSYIRYFHRQRHTAQLREGYAASAGKSRDVAQEWDVLGEETWARLDKLEKKAKISR
ncbi:MAG: hypothetical protein Greene041619_598 [Candidatus Peregrinibacteria bacterium Greene0416_19]|nr:MAG: hypothetical protein Greene041619_598 [Candidatus Peregrinibacteria bacterium Greene0416_19]